MFSYDKEQCNILIVSDVYGDVAQFLNKAVDNSNEKLFRGVIGQEFYLYRTKEVNFRLRYRPTMQELTSSGMAKTHYKCADPDMVFLLVNNLKTLQKNKELLSELSELKVETQKNIPLYLIQSGDSTSDDDLDKTIIPTKFDLKFNEDTQQSELQEFIFSCYKKYREYREKLPNNLREKLQNNFAGLNEYQAHFYISTSYPTPEHFCVIYQLEQTDPNFKKFKINFIKKLEVSLKTADWTNETLLFAFAAIYDRQHFIRVDQKPKWHNTNGDTESYLQIIYHLAKKLLQIGINDMDEELLEKARILLSEMHRLPVPISIPMLRAEWQNEWKNVLEQLNQVMPRNEVSINSISSVAKSSPPSGQTDEIKQPSPENSDTHTQSSIENKNSFFPSENIIETLPSSNNKNPFGIETDSNISKTPPLELPNWKS